MAAIGNRNFASISMLDFSNELRAITLPTEVITAVSLPNFLTIFGNLQTAIDAVTLGRRARQSWGENSVISNTPPTAKDAQVETEILVRVRGATSEAPYSFRIPTADYNAFNWVKDSAVLSGAGATQATTDLIAAIQAVARMPDDNTESVVVYAIEVVE